MKKSSDTFDADDTYSSTKPILLETGKDTSLMRISFPPEFQKNYSR
jgi:hypothetical protein